MGPLLRRLLLLAAIQGLATTFSQPVGFLFGIAIGVSIAILAWSLEHPVVWWYDLLFALSVAATAVASTGIYAGVCSGASAVGYTLSTCAQLGVGDALRMHLAVLCASSFPLWLALRVWVWASLRAQ